MSTWDEIREEMDDKFVRYTSVLIVMLILAIAVVVQSMKIQRLEKQIETTRIDK